MHPIRFIIPALLFALSLPATAFAQAVLVEDFELPDTGNFITYTSGQFIVTATNTWTVTQNSVDLYEGPARAEADVFDGSQAVDLTGSPGEGIIETTFSTTPGTQYELVFHYARNDLLGASTGDAQVDVIGAGQLLQALIQHDPAQHTFSTYLQFSDTFTANSAQTTLRFTGLDPGVAGVTLDGITVTGIPAIPALAGGPYAFGAGVLLLLMAMSFVAMRQRRTG